MIIYDACEGCEVKKTKQKRNKGKKGTKIYVLEWINVVAITLTKWITIRKTPLHVSWFLL